MLTGLAKKPFILIPAVMISATTLVAILAWTAMKPINQKNGFTRKLTPAAIKVENILEHNGIVNLSGITKDRLYFQTKNSSVVLTTDYSLKNEGSLKLTVPVNNRKLDYVVYIFVDSPYVHTLAGRMPAVIEGNINNSLAFRAYKFPSGLFTRCVMINPGSYVFRCFDSSLKTVDQIFVKGNPLTGTIKRENNISERNGDAGISTDGTLCFDRKNNLIIYSFNYRNKFLCLDTNLNLLYTGHTIDTIENKQIKSDINKDVLTAVTPKRHVNTSSDAYDGILYNKSAVKGDNETWDEFRSNATIDMYELKNGTYIGSFYVANYNNERILRFRVIDNKLIAIYKSAVVSYTLDLDRMGFKRN